MDIRTEIHLKGQTDKIDKLLLNIQFQIIYQPPKSSKTNYKAQMLPTNRQPLRQKQNSDKRTDRQRFI